MFTDTAYIPGIEKGISYCGCGSDDLPVRTPARPKLKHIDTWAKLAYWDMTNVIKRLVAKGHAKDHQEADEMVTEYMKFMSLCAFYNMTFPMSTAVDEAWHAHILFTKDYAAFCQHIAGRFIHHTPTTSEEELKELDEPYNERTLKYYEKHFGPAPEKWWPRCGQICGCGGTGTCKACQ